MNDTLNLCMYGKCPYNQDGVCTCKGYVLPCGRKVSDENE